MTICIIVGSATNRSLFVLIRMFFRDSSLGCSSQTGCFLGTQLGTDALIEFTLSSAPRAILHTVHSVEC